MPKLIVTETQLKAIMPLANPVTLRACLEPLNSALAEFNIDTPARAAAIIAQIAHETGQFHYFREIWGATPQQLKYDPPNALAKQLGNIRRCDGKQFRGRGAIQLTGRANYRKFGRLLSLPLEDQPDMAAQPAVCFRIAGAYWNDRNLSKWADSGDFEHVTRAINGGLNGQAERLMFWERAKAQLGA